MKKAFHKNNAPVVYLFVLHIGWLGNVQIFIMRAEPLYDSVNRLFCDVFAAVVVCARSLLLWSIKSHDLDLKNSKRTIIVFHTGKDCTICPWKFLEIRPEIFGRMVSAHGLGRTYRKAMFLARSSDNKSAR